MTGIFRSKADRDQEHDCFILCDAGGGTVDVVSYQVKRMRPFELEKATQPSGTSIVAFCGIADLSQVTNVDPHGSTPSSKFGYARSSEGKNMPNSTRDTHVSIRVAPTLPRLAT